MKAFLAASVVAMTLVSFVILPGRVQAGPTLVRMQWGVPLSAQDVGDDRPGRGGGVSVTHMGESFVGFGVDVLAHDWPASASYRESFDRYLRSTRFETIRGTEWGFTALQMTAHVRLALPGALRFAPWMQVGGGAYRLDLNLNEVRTADTYAWVEGPEVSQKSWTVAGGYAEAGLDLHVFSRLALGMDLTVHDVITNRKGEGLFASSRLPDFQALTFGTHLQFGW